MKTVVWVFAVLALGCAPALAFDPLATRQNLISPPPPRCKDAVPQDKPLALVDVVHYTLCHNPDTRESWAFTLEQAARLGSARSAYLPNVDGALSLNWRRTHGGASSGTSTTLSPAIALDYLLLDFGGRAATVETARQALLSTNYSYNATLQTVLFTAVQAYYQLFTAEAAVASAQENLKAAQASLDAASLRYKVGTVTLGDQLQAEAARDQALLAQQQAQNQAHSSRGTLANVMGLRPDYPFHIVQETPKGLEEGFTETIDQLLAAAKKARPELAASEADLAGARANLKVQQADAWPTLNLSANHNYNDILPGGTGSTDSSAIGVTLHVPIFTGFDRTYRIREARAEVMAQTARRNATENEILLDVWQAYGNFQTALQAAHTSQTLLTSAGKAQEIALGRYKEGLISITELLSAQAQLASARQQYVQAQYGWLTAKADLLRASGRLNPNTITGTP